MAGLAQTRAKVKTLYLPVKTPVTWDIVKGQKQNCEAIILLTGKLYLVIPKANIC